MDEQKLKQIMYALIAVAVVLAGTLAYIWWQKSSLVNDLKVGVMLPHVVDHRVKQVGLTKA